MHTLTIDYNDKQFERLFVKSLHETGFAVIKNHSIDQNLINKVYSDWDIFFKSDKKNNYIFDYEKQDGYFPYKSENAANNNTKDLKEFFHIYPNWGRYPNFISEDSLVLFKDLTNLGEQLLKSIDKHSPNSIRKTYSEHLYTMSKDSDQNLMRVIHYPPITEINTKNEIRAGAHTDINLITLLVSGSQPGLQVKGKSNKWIDIKSQKGQIIVNNGDMLQECSGNYFPSTLHKVVNPKKSNNISRFSIPLFIHPRNDVILSDRYTAGSYLLERLQDIGLK